LSFPKRSYRESKSDRAKQQPFKMRTSSKDGTTCLNKRWDWGMIWVETAC